MRRWVNAGSKRPILEVVGGVGCGEDIVSKLVGVV